MCKFLGSLFGFVIPGQRMLTNAHVVADHTFVLVRKHGSPSKYRAVQAIGHECDLAILTVDSKEFWEGMKFLELGDIPFLQGAVAVVGYPQGMEKQRKYLHVEDEDLTSDGSSVMWLTGFCESSEVNNLLQAVLSQVQGKESLLHRTSLGALSSKNS